MFKVEWLASAERELATLWLGARDREAITEAVDRADHEFRLDPESVGESRDEDFRIAFFEPVVILLRVLREGRQVEVIHVWRKR